LAHPALPYRKETPCPLSPSAHQVTAAGSPSTNSSPPPAQIVATGADYTSTLTATGLPPELAAAAEASQDLIKLLISRPAPTAHEVVDNAATIEVSR
jgi:hypothetical protein